MSELICDTTVVQYLHRIGLLRLLPVLASQVIIPTAVAEELAAGIAQGIELPKVMTLDWARLLSPISKPPLPDANDLGTGESEVLWLALERPDGVAVLDDSKARQVAARMGIRFTGTLGLLLDAKQAGLIPLVAPHMIELRKHNFYVSPRARESILRKAGESS